MIIRILIYSAIAAMAVFNGIYSPKAFTVFALQGIWYPAFLATNLTLMFVLSGMITTLLHAVVTGIPTAVLERFYPHYVKSTVSALLWFATLLVPTVLTLMHLISD